MIMDDGLCHDNLHNLHQPNGELPSQSGLSGLTETQLSLIFPMFDTVRAWGSSLWIKKQMSKHQADLASGHD